MAAKISMWRTVLACAFCVLAIAGTGLREPAAAAVRNPDGIAVIIGNGNYTGTGKVLFAHRDAAAFRRYVLDVLGFDAANVIYLQDATQAQMIGVFGNAQDARGKLWFYLDPDEGRKLSDVVVFYSGHGMPGLNEKTPGAYLLPVDANPTNPRLNGYSVDLLYRNLGKVPARTVSVFLDACFTGRGGDGKPHLKASPVIQKAGLPDSVAPNMTVLTAARHDQLAYWDTKAGHGMFTHHLLDALYGGGDANGDGKVTAAEVEKHLRRHMRRAVRRTYQNDQVAKLLDGSGKGTAVLASAAGGGFPKRPAFRLEDSPEKPVAALTPNPEAAETALGLDHRARIGIERGLQFLGHQVGRPDGVFGKNTRVALRSWQANQQVKATGFLTRPQSDALIALGKRWSTLTLQTVPPNARVRVFTNTGSNYRAGMVLTRGQYEIAVEAAQYEPFRQRLAVEGPTAYRISLCKRETRQQSVCENKPVTRHRTETKKEIRTMTERDSIRTLVGGGLSKETTCSLALEELAKQYVVRGEGGLGLYEHSARVTEVEYATKRYMKQECRSNGGVFTRTIKRVGEFKSWDAKTRCSCTSTTGYRSQCKVSLTWRCAYKTTVKVPYKTIERKCRNVSKTERMCPEKAVLRLQ
ncbi:MAG: caspase family protein [Defluviicoccus sp.]|nr:caspase family protein [Defluviicoccus sp.]